MRCKTGEYIFFYLHSFILYFVTITKRFTQLQISYEYRNKNDISFMNIMFTLFTYK